MKEHKNAIPFARVAEMISDCPYLSRQQSHFEQQPSFQLKNVRVWPRVISQVNLTKWALTKAFIQLGFVDDEALASDDRGFT